MPALFMNGTDANFKVDRNANRKTFEIVMNVANVVNKQLGLLLNLTM